MIIRRKRIVVISSGPLKWLIKKKCNKKCRKLLLSMNCLLEVGKRREKILSNHLEAYLLMLVGQKQDPEVDVYDD